MINFSLFALLITLLLFSVTVEGQVNQCPSAEDGFPEECSCYGIGFLSVTCRVTPIQDNYWNVTETFNEVANSLPDDTNLLSVMLMVPIQPEVPIELFEHTVAGFSSQIFNWLNADSFYPVHTNAFSGLYANLTSLIYQSCWYNCPENFYEIVNQFEVLLQLVVSNTKIYKTLTTTETQTFPQVITNIEYLFTTLETVGPNPFSNFPNLELLRLESNCLSDEAIADEAFDGIPANILFSIRENPFLTHLSERKFKNLLDNGATIGVGIIFEDIPDYDLYCDERSNWICENASIYSEKLIGFRCRESVYTDIFDYCEQTFNTKIERRDNSKAVARLASLQNYHGADEGMKTRTTGWWDRCFEE